LKVRTLDHGNCYTCLCNNTHFQSNLSILLSSKEVSGNNFNQNPDRDPDRKDPPDSASGAAVAVTDNQPEKEALTSLKKKPERLYEMDELRIER
jgi:hypothetical protein